MEDIKAELIKAYHEKNGKITEDSLEELIFKKYNITEPVVKGLLRLNIHNFIDGQKLYSKNKNLTSQLSLKTKEYNKNIISYDIKIKELKNYYRTIIFYLIIFLGVTSINKIWCLLI